MSNARNLSNLLGGKTTLSADNVEGVQKKEVTSDTTGLGSGQQADQKFVAANKSLYVYDGAEWDRITGDNSFPFVQTEPPTTVQGLDGFTAGATLDITMKVIDPDGFPIKYSIDYKADSMNPIEPHGLGYTGNNGLKIFAADSLPFQLDSVSIDQTNGIFKFASKLSDSFAGSFNARLSATDGINTVSRVVPISLSFISYYDISGGSEGNSTTYVAPNGTRIVASGNSYNTSSYNIKHLTEGPGSTYWLASGGQDQNLTLDFSNSTGISKVAYIRIWPRARTDQYSRLNGVYKGNELNTTDTQIHGSSLFNDLANGSGGFDLAISMTGSSDNSATKGYKDLNFSPHVDLSVTPYITIDLYHAAGTDWGTSSDEIQVYGY